MIIDQETRKDAMYKAGREAALSLEKEAKDLTGTQIIDRELDVPDYDPKKDYTNTPVGAPVADEGQVWTLIQPHNAAEYQGRPSTLRALWGLCHTTNPAKAKPWVDAYGISGLYKKGECYLHSDGTVRRCLVEETNFSADAMPSYWETVDLDTWEPPVVEPEEPDPVPKPEPEPEQPEGAKDNPITASRGMTYEYGLYYYDPEDAKTYLCQRQNETGTIELDYLPHELIRHYFVEV